MSGTLFSSLVGTRTYCKNKPFLKPRPVPGRMPQPVLLSAQSLITMIQRTGHADRSPQVPTLSCTSSPHSMAPCPLTMVSAWRHNCRGKVKDSCPALFIVGSVKCFILKSQNGIAPQSFKKQFTYQKGMDEEIEDRRQKVSQPKSQC